MSVGRVICVFVVFNSLFNIGSAIPFKYLFINDTTMINFEIKILSLMTFMNVIIVSKIYVTIRINNTKKKRINVIVLLFKINKYLELEYYVNCKFVIINE